MIYKESNQLELKEKYTNSFLKTVSAFSNEREGKVIFGIRDDGSIVGVDNSEDTRLSIENSINDAIHPTPNFRLITEKVEDKEIVVLYVFKGTDGPYFYKGQAYQRSDTASKPADIWQLKRWILESSNLSFDRQVIEESGFTFSHLEKNMIAEIGIGEMSDDLLRTLGLMVGDKFTNAGRLFADENDVSIGIDAVKFGKNISQFLKRKSLSNITILEQFQEMEQFFDEFYYDYEEIVEGRRISRIRLPRDAFREALANAIVHHDYLIQANIRIEFWDKAIKIVSPGGLPNGITEAQFQSGTVSILRNEVIASVFQRLNIIESFATGIRRIKELYYPYAESPKFNVLGDSITVILPIIDYARKRDLDEITVRIIDFLTEIPRSRGEIQEVLSLGRSRVNDYINHLLELGMIKKIGAGPVTKYQTADGINAEDIKL
ncbi:MAG: putative DNA binding domain-containing protein [Streptococcaceae bacterium]|jgi:ATP-dependent DNA helicase RecG|nr:putative DNA binding domain-containing protein [Streptococcaceae bacterium]